MSAIVSEIVGQKGRLSADANAELAKTYHVSGVSTEADAIAACNAFLLSSLGSPIAIGSLPLDTIDATEIADSIYECVATFRTFQRRSAPAVGEVQFSFELGTLSTEVAYPVGAISVYRSGSDSWQPQLLNDDGKGSQPSPVPILEPTYDESETHWVPLDSITLGYRQTLKALIGKTNATFWKGNQPGEALLTGVSGTRRGASDAELTFRWSVRENQTGITIGGITGVSKQGWQYLWVRYETTRTSDDEPSVETPSHVCVASVYRSADLSLLGIGV